MKNLLLIITTILVSNIVLSQSPQGFSYQAIIRDSKNDVVNNRDINSKISILHGSENGEIVYSESQIAKTNINGLLSLVIGKGNILSGDFTKINWANGPFFIKSETDITGGINYGLTTITQLMSVPFAMYSQNSGSGYTHYLGEEFGGGVIYSLWKDKDGKERGLIVSKVDLGKYKWDNNSKLISTKSDWDGQINTDQIVNNSDNSINTCAKICLDYVSEGFTDWYLPSILELTLLTKHFLQIQIIKKLTIMISYGAVMNQQVKIWQF